MFSSIFLPDSWSCRFLGVIQRQTPGVGFSCDVSEPEHNYSLLVAVEVGEGLVLLKGFAAMSYH